MISFEMLAKALGEMRSNEANARKYRDSETVRRSHCMVDIHTTTTMLYDVAEKCGAVHPPSLLELGRTLQVVGQDILNMHEAAIQRAKEKAAAELTEKIMAAANGNAPEPAGFTGPTR
jgi:hypothetical protein